MEENKKLSGEATSEQIAMWKNLHRDVFEVKVSDKICYLKRPDRKTLSAAESIGYQDPMRYNEVILENCWLGGDSAIKTNDVYFLETVPVLEQLIDYGRAEIKKL
jgi:hypothetical protein